MTLCEENAKIKIILGCDPLQTPFQITSKKIKPKIMQHYIYLDPEDKAKITKQAFSKCLSLSAYVDIITCNYYAIANSKKDTYIHKGQKQICLKIKDSKNFQFTDKILTNAVYLFLHGKQTDYKLFNLQKLNRSIQSQADKTTDPNFMKNQLIRATWRQNK